MNARYIVRSDFSKHSDYPHYFLVDTIEDEILDYRKPSQSHQMYEAAHVLNKAYREGDRFTRNQHWQLSKHYISRYKFNNFRDARDYHSMWKKAYQHFKLSGRPHMPID